MTIAAGPNRPQFLLAGVIGSWDHRMRQLEIAGQICWVAPEVLVWGVRAGIWVTVAGYRDDRADRRIVTRLTFG
jgi:hypothetical protein